MRAQPDGTHHPKAQRNFVDPDSRIMESGGSFLQGYNCQVAVDEEHQIIVAQAVTNQCPDNGNLLPLLDQVQENCGAAPKLTTAHAGYWFAEVEQEAAQRSTEVYVAPDRQRHGVDRAPPEPASDAELTAKDRMRAKLRTPEGRAIYARRKAVVEPVNGQIKEARRFRRFLVRGLHAVSGQWALISTAHNALKLYRATTPGLEGLRPPSPVGPRPQPPFPAVETPPHWLNLTSLEDRALLAARPRRRPQSLSGTRS